MRELNTDIAVRAAATANQIRSSSSDVSLIQLGPIDLQNLVWFLSQIKQRSTQTTRSISRD